MTNRQEEKMIQNLEKLGFEESGDYRMSKDFHSNLTVEIECWDNSYKGRLYIVNPKENSKEYYLAVIDIQFDTYKSLKEFCRYIERTEKSKFIIETK